LGLGHFLNLLVIGHWRIGIYFFMSTDKKKLHMWLAVGGVMLVIFLVWISSVKYSIKAAITDFSSAQKENFDNLNQTRADFTKQITQLKEALGQINATSTPRQARGEVANEAATSSAE
jgi:peptidoglycan hydrolase CwlO-like protein